MAHTNKVAVAQRARPWEVTVVIGYIVLPWLATILAAYQVYLQTTTSAQIIGWKEVLLLIGGYIYTIEGVSLGNHRSVTHPTYQTYRWMKYLIYAGGAMAIQGKLLTWRRDHLHHHEKTDVPCSGGVTPSKCDPHTPRDHFWHAAYGWLVKPFLSPGKLALDKETELLQTMGERNASKEKIAVQRTVVENVRIGLFVDTHLPIFILLGLIIPLVIGGMTLAGWNWSSAWNGLLWGGLVRICLVNFFTAMVNSYCHKPGWFGNYRHAKVADDSRNGLIFALVNPEWPHANHHLFPDSANQGIYWWERIFDYSASILWVGERLGLFWNINWTTVAMLQERKRLVEQSPKSISVEATMS